MPKGLRFLVFYCPYLRVQVRNVENVQAVQDVGYISRKSFPVAWGGKIDKELQSVSGVLEAVFCHRGLFFAVAKSKEGAIKLAELALDS